MQISGTVYMDTNVCYICTLTLQPLGGSGIPKNLIPQPMGLATVIALSLSTVCILSLLQTCPEVSFHRHLAHLPDATGYDLLHKSES